VYIAIALIVVIKGLVNHLLSIYLMRLSAIW